MSSPIPYLVPNAVSYPGASFLPNINRTALPMTAPVGGCFLFSEGNVIKGMLPSGVVTIGSSSGPSIPGWTFASGSNISRQTATNATARLIPGASGFFLRDAADANTNLGMSDAGAATIRTSLVIGTDPGGSNIARIGGSLTINSAGEIMFGGRSRIGSSADGRFLITDAAGTDFNRLQFGGTTASFPALKRNGPSVEVAFADDSGYGNIGIGNLVLNNAASAAAGTNVKLGKATQTTVGAAGAASALPATPSGYLRFFIGATEYVLPYYAQA